MSLPYFPLYPTDFEAKTSHLSLIEDGAYNRLLRLCWMTPGCSLPNDEAWIMRRMRATDEAERAAVRVVLAEFFTVTNGRLSNARLAREWLAANEAHDRRKNAGAKGGAAKALKTNTAASSNARAMPKQPEPEPEPYKEETEPKGSVADMPPPIDEIAQAVSAYNATAKRTGWPIVQKVSKERRSALRARLTDCGGATGWEVALAKAEASEFLTGQTPKPFMASFDWITNRANFTKLMEGNYDNRNRARSTPANGPQNRPDPALEQILRLTGLADAPGVYRP